MLARVRTKICGITTTEDALSAIDAGADALGFVFYEPSPRYISPLIAADICRALPPFVTTVGLFVDHPRDVVQGVCDKVPLSLLQFHGDEPEGYCTEFATPYIKALRVRDQDTVANAENEYPSAQALLVDTYKKGIAGGTGEAFDWGLLPAHSTKPLILAGGLNPENVRNAISRVRPYAVDVSGGVERAKGVKDQNKIIRFLKEVSSEC